MHNRVVVAASYGLVRAALSTVRFNFRGAGRSPGRFDGGRGEREDVRVALAELAARVPGLPLVVAGYSFGASVGLPVGASDDRVDALLGIGVPLQLGGPPPVTSHQGPLLLVQGDRDEFGPLETLRSWAATLSGEVEVVAVTGADHFFMGDRVREVAAAAERLGRRVTGSSLPRPAPGSS
jgi:alpha/beta superfamily hydrolase